MVYFIIGLSFVITFIPNYREGFDEMKYIKDNPQNFIKDPPKDLTGDVKEDCKNYDAIRYGSLVVPALSLTNTCKPLVSDSIITGYFAKDLTALRRIWKEVTTKKDEYSKTANNADTNVISFINTVNSNNKSLQYNIPPIITEIDSTFDQMHKFHTITILKDTTSDIGKLYSKLQDLKKWLNMIKHSNTIAINAGIISQQLPSTKVNFNVWGSNVEMERSEIDNNIYFNKVFKFIAEALTNIEIYITIVTTTIYNEITNIITEISTFINNASVVEDKVNEYINQLNKLITSLKKIQDSIKMLKNKIDYTSIKKNYIDYSLSVKYAEAAQNFENTRIKPYKDSMYGRSTSLAS